MKTPLLLLGLLVACGSSEPLERSCNGKAIINCLPYEFSIIESASLLPDAATLDDPDVMVDVRVQLMHCEMLDRPLEVTIELRVGTDEATRVVDVVTVRDNGENGDTTARDGLIEQTLPNPFFGAEFPANSDVTMVFQARAPADCSGPMCIGGTCRSDAFEAPYRTGSRLVPEA